MIASLFNCQKFQRKPPPEHDGEFGENFPSRELSGSLPAGRSAGGFRSSTRSSRRSFCAKIEEFHGFEVGDAVEYWIPSRKKFLPASIAGREGVNYMLSVCIGDEEKTLNGIQAMRLRRIFRSGDAVDVCIGTIDESGLCMDGEWLPGWVDEEPNLAMYNVRLQAALEESQVDKVINVPAHLIRSRYELGQQLHVPRPSGGWVDAEVFSITLPPQSLVPLPAQLLTLRYSADDLSDSSVNTALALSSTMVRIPPGRPADNYWDFMALRNSSRIDANPGAATDEQIVDVTINSPNSPGAPDAQQPWENMPELGPTLKDILEGDLDLDATDASQNPLGGDSAYPAEHTLWDVDDTADLPDHPDEDEPPVMPATGKTEHHADRRAQWQEACGSTKPGTGQGMDEAYVDHYEEGGFVEAAHVAQDSQQADMLYGEGTRATVAVPSNTTAACEETEVPEEDYHSPAFDQATAEEPSTAQAARQEPQQQEAHEVEEYDYFAFKPTPR
eukprot:TRINITY_DN50446_c0_g1_i1.p1 TRINITY_DN50446_c0_g1~~TRINITY_DN50446_c0_g1_i1.p1  ORF type:complete len:501 (+),score=66.00 TRINITY_DN50446_c0_g1_i1:131-1633(+)